MFKKIFFKIKNFKANKQKKHSKDKKTWWNIIELETLL